MPLVRIEGVEKKAYDRAFVHHVAADAVGAAGDRVQVRGRIVADGYGFRNHRNPGAPDTVMVVYDRVRRRAFYSYFSAPQG